MEEIYSFKGRIDSSELRPNSGCGRGAAGVRPGCGWGPVRSGASTTLRSLEPTASSLRSLFGRISSLQNALRSLSRALEIPGRPLGDPPRGARSLENQCFPTVSLRFLHIRRFAHPGPSGRSPRLSRGSSGTSRGSPKGSRHSLGALPGAPGGLRDALRGLRDALPDPPGALLAAPEAFPGTPCLPNSLPELPRGFPEALSGSPGALSELLQGFLRDLPSPLAKVSFEEAVEETSEALRSHLRRTSMLE